MLDSTDSGRKPTHGIFLILKGTLFSKNTGGCLHDVDWKIDYVDFTSDISADTDAMKDLKFQYQLDYPGWFLGICVSEREEKPMFVVFDVKKARHLKLVF